MFRILIATSGYYYVQRQTNWHFDKWSKVGGFFISRAGARQFIRDQKRCCTGPKGRVVEYVS